MGHGYERQFEARASRPQRVRYPENLAEAEPLHQNTARYWTLVMTMSTLVAIPTGGGGHEPRNRLLAALPDGDLRMLQPYLETVPLAGDCVLYDAEQALTRVYFLETGVAAWVASLGNRAAIGMAAVGHEGVVDVAALLLGGAVAMGRCHMLVPGSALTMDASVFRTALDQSPKLRAACEAYARALLVQLLQAVACNRQHTPEQRCARWLLMCADRTEDNPFELREEHLAQMLGVVIVRKLQDAGVIDQRGSAIAVVDRHGLEAAACECYRIVRDRYERELGPRSRQTAPDSLRQEQPRRSRTAPREKRT